MKKFIVMTVVLVLVLGIGSMTLAKGDTASQQILDKFTVSGDVYFRYDLKNTGGSSSYEAADNNNGSYLDLLLTMKVNDNWTANAKIQDKLLGNVADKEDAMYYDTNASLVYAEGLVWGANVTMGQFNYASQYGLVADMTLHGAEVVFSNFDKKLKTKIGIGRLPSKCPSFLVKDSDGSACYRGVVFKYDLSKVVGFAASFHDVVYHGDDTIMMELGYEQQLSENFRFRGNYIQSDVENVGDDNKGYYGRLTYKKAQFQVPGSYDIFLAVDRLPLYISILSTNIGNDKLAVAAMANPNTDIRINNLFCVSICIPLF